MADLTRVCGNTSLAWAALNGHKGVAKILLERDDVNQEKPDKRCRNAALVAAGDRHDRVMKNTARTRPYRPW